MVVYRVASMRAPTLALPAGLIRFVTHIAASLALSVGLAPAPAGAFLDPPYITPANPTVGVPISVNVYGGQCDLLDYGIEWPPPVTQEGSEITILFFGIHEADLEWCYYGIGLATFPVGTYPEGSYTLDVERQYFNFAGVLVQETLGIIPFTVTGSVPARTEAAPTLGTVGIYGLLLALMALAARHSRSLRLEQHE